MLNMSASKKSISIIASTILLVSVLVPSLSLHYIYSTKEYCSHYASIQSKGYVSPDRQYAEFQDTYLRDKRLGGF